MYSQTDTTIEFTYPIAEIEAKLSMQSSYGAKNIAVPPTGEDAVDAYSLSADERDFVGYHIRGAIASLFSLFVWRSDGVKNAVFAQKEIGEQKTVCCGFVVKREMENDKPCYNENRLPIIDLSCENFIVYSILLEWAKTNKMADDVAIYQKAVTENSQQIILQYAEIRKGRYGKTYNIEKQ